MPLAEVIVRRGDRGAPPIPLDNVATRFEVAITERGPVGTPIEARSWSRLRDAVGSHTPYTTLRASESYFAEGGTRTVLSRVVGPAARTAVLALRDRDGAAVLTVTAEGPGSWYHGITVKVEAGGGTDDRVVTIARDGVTLVSGTVTDEASLEALFASAPLVKAVGGPGRYPIATLAATPLAGGDDDRANVRDAQVTAALSAFADSLGPGSVCASGWTSVPVHRALAVHAAAHNRVARADLPDTDSAEDLVGHASQIRALPEAHAIQLLAGWPQVTVAGTTIAVPPSGVHTGREARTDRETGPGVGQPCAWTFGEYVTPIGVSRSWSRSDRESMTDAGITIIVQDQGEVYAEDAITAADPVSRPQFAEVAPMRVTMAIHNQCKAVLRNRVRQVIDGHGHLAAATVKDLVSICSAWYERDALYGRTAAEAFSVSVTPEIVTGEPARLVGNIVLRPSQSVQTVELTITQVAAGDTI